MKTSRDKEHIARLLKSYAMNPSTEEMLYLVAETSGMMDACKWLTQTSTANDRDSRDWVNGICHDNKVDLLKFLAEIQHVLALFTPIQATDSSLYALLDLAPGASREAVKQRYRQLCRRYHPDTARNSNEQHTEAFINITKAYHTLLSSMEERTPPAQTATNYPWRWHSGQENRNELKRKNLLWFSILAIVLAALSLMAARTYNTHVMMAGLRNKGTAFVPPQRKPAVEDEKPDWRTPPLQERNEIDRSPQKSPDPSPPTAATALALSAGPEKLAVASVTVSTPLESQSENQTPTLPSSVANESVSHRKEASKSALPLSHTTGQRMPEQVALNPTAEQNATHRAEPVGSTISKPADSTNRLLEKPPGKLIGSALPGALSQKSTKANVEKEQQKPTLQQQGTAQHISPRSAQADQPTSSRPSPEQQTQKKIETFLQDYTTAYHQKNLLAFSRFFASDATENGKSLKEVLTVYNQLFEKTDSLRLAISLLNWQHAPALLHLRGRFTIVLGYKDGKKIQGRGAIDFQIIDTQEEWRIKTLTYSFDE